MKIFPALLMFVACTLSVNVAYAQMDASSAMDQMKQQATGAVSETTDHMSTSGAAMTPTQCATMMKEHYDNMNMDAKMMNDMKQCKAMMGDKMKGMNMGESNMMPKAAE
jgi:hypothetical protein